MSEYGSNLVLRKSGKPVMCADFGAVPQTPHQAAAYCPCFTPGTLIKTNFGEVAVEMLTTGMQVLTRDNGYQPVIWVGRRELGDADLIATPELKPIKIIHGALGQDLPERDTVVSPQYRMLLSNAQIREWFDADEVLVAAHLLTCFEGVSREDVSQVTYIHFMFEQHEIVLADGAWSESFQPGDMRLGAMDQRHREELLTIFPDLEIDTQEKYPAARKSVSADDMMRAVLSEE
jgi:hypothetical protein